MESPITVEEHYLKAGLLGRVSSALEEAGLSEQVQNWKEFAPLDQFHVRGLDATTELAEGLGLTSGKTLLDVGCGLGGPARHLAADFEVQITGIDLSESFIEAARFLTVRSGLGELLDFRVANALSLPFGEASFDFVWTQHVAMNIADRPKLYGEMFRVLKSGGRLAIYDVVIGNGEAPVYPVPWAETPEISHLVSPEEMRSALEAVGFSVVSWEDKTDVAVEWLDRQTASSRTMRPLGLHVVMGLGFGTMVGNLAGNVRSGRLRLVQAILRRE